MKAAKSMALLSLSGLSPGLSFLFATYLKQLQPGADGLLELQGWVCEWRRICCR